MQTARSGGPFAYPQVFTRLSRHIRQAITLDTGFATHLYRYVEQVRNRAVWLVLISIASVQIGAAFAKSLFTEVSPISMAWLRLACAGAVLLLTRPSYRGLTRKDWLTGLALATCLVCMNIAIYESIARIPLGLAVTIEFIGPLGVAMLGCRRARDLVWVVLAGIGVAMLGVKSSHDLVGIALAVIAGLCWGGYILLGGRLSSSWRGTSVLTLTCGLGAIALAPAALTSGNDLLRPNFLLIGLAVGLLSSVIPYTLELHALKTIPPRVFGILMALEPGAAALAATVVLHEWLSLTDWVAVACVIVASIGAVRSSRPTSPSDRSR